MTPIMHHDDIRLNEAVFDLVDEIQTITFLNNGTGHAYWRIQTPTQALLWRQRLTSSGAPGSHSARELQILNAISDQPWAPEVLANLPDIGMLMPLYEGTHPTSQTPPSEQARIALLSHVISLWKTPCPVKPYNYKSLVLSYLALTPEPKLWQLLADRLIEQAQWPEHTFRLTHHDLHAENLLLHEDHWIILDWEYAGLANPWIDAVMLDQWLTLTENERQLVERFLPCLGLPQPWTSMHEWVRGLNQLWHAALTFRTEPTI